MTTIEILENKAVDIKGKVLGDIFGANVVCNGLNVFVPVSYPTREGVEKRANKIVELIKKGKYTQYLKIALV